VECYWGYFIRVLRDFDLMVSTDPSGFPLTKPIRLAPLSAAIAAFVLWTACANHSVKADGSLKPEGTRKVAPEFTLKDSNGL
jgi:hypothetical protein